MISVKSYIETSKNNFANIEENISALKAEIEKREFYFDIWGGVELKYENEVLIDLSHPLYIISFWVVAIPNIKEYFYEQQCRISVNSQTVTILLKKKSDTDLLYTLLVNGKVVKECILPEKEFLWALTIHAENIFNEIIRMSPKDDEIPSITEDILIDTTSILGRLGDTDRQAFSIPVIK